MSMQEYQENTPIEEVPIIKKSNTMKKIASLLFITLIGFGGWTYYRKVYVGVASTSGDKKLTEAEQKALVSNYLAQVGKHMLLPLNDDPVIATVDDPAVLIKQQAFFTGSVKGDVVLIFPKTQRAILYSPSRNKIVNAGPVMSGNQNKPQDATLPTTDELQP